MFSLAHVQAAREHYADLIREADHERLARQAVEQSMNRKAFYGRFYGRFYSRALARLGQGMNAFGCYLVHRYGDAEACPAPAQCAHGRIGGAVLLRTR